MENYSSLYCARNFCKSDEVTKVEANIFRVTQFSVYIEVEVECFVELNPKMSTLFFMSLMIHRLF